MLYAEGADARVRVRAAHVDDACSAVAKRLARSGSHWSRTVRRPADVLSPICRFVDPARRVELEVMDDSANPARGARVCSSLARAGWFDLTSP